MDGFDLKTKALLLLRSKRWALEIRNKTQGHTFNCAQCFFWANTGRIAVELANGAEQVFFFSSRAYPTNAART